MAKQNSRNYNEPTNQTINILGEGTTIKGDIVANSDIRIDGELQGSLVAQGRIVIGTKGKVDGEIKGKNIEVSGIIKGKINIAELLCMKATAKIEGDIIAGRLSIEPGAVFSGNCTMGDNNQAKNNARTES